MAKHNVGDILTCDWNPVIGCEKYSKGCQHCWYLEGIFPCHKRMGLIPADVSPVEAMAFEKRLTIDSRKSSSKKTTTPDKL